MKKTYQLSLVLIALVLPLLAGCDGNNQAPANDFVGAWLVSWDGNTDQKNIAFIDEDSFSVSNVLNPDPNVGEDEFYHAYVYDAVQGRAKDVVSSYDLTATTLTLTTTGAKLDPTCKYLGDPKTETFCDFVDFTDTKGFTIVSVGENEIELQAADGTTFVLSR